MARLLLHFVGDIHQPLHGVQYFSTKYPNGDKGGNDIILNFQGKVNKNLNLANQFALILG